LLGRRQRMALVGSFAVGAALVGLLRQVHLVLPSSAVSDELGTIPLSAVEIGKLHDRGPLATRVIAVAGRFGLDPALVMAVIEVESGRDPTALSPKGAVGLMQVMPETAALVGFPEPADPASNLAAGCGYLATLLDSFGGDVELALAAYNAGPGAVRRWGTIPPYRETREFVQRVGAAYHRLTGADLLTTERVGEGSSTLF
jgi:soluble lytic murein transglycosylase-like protein